MESMSLCKGIRFCCFKEKNAKKAVTISKDGTLIKSTVDKAAEITKDDAKTIQDEKDVQMKVPNVAIGKELKEFVVDFEKEYDVLESMGEAPLKSLLIFPLSLEESDLDSLTSYVNQSLMTVSDTVGVGWILFWQKSA